MEGVQLWTLIFVGASFALYISIAIWSRVASTKEFYIAGSQVPPAINGMATAADWMSAASFLSMAGVISFMGLDGSVYLLGWTGGFVLLALLIAPYLRKFGQYTIPDFVGDRYYSTGARIIAILSAVLISLVYIAGQMRGVGIVFARFLEVDVTIGVLLGAGIVFIYAILGGMKGITYTQVAQYCVLIVAYLIPAIFVAFLLTGNIVPQLALGDTLVDEPGVYVLEKLDQLHRDFGFPLYTSRHRSVIDVLAITLALMIGTAGLPHVLIRFYTVPRIRDARISAGWALLFIGILYTTAPAVAAFSRVNLFASVNEQPYEAVPKWFKEWEKSGLIAWADKNGDGRIQYRPGKAFDGPPQYTGETGEYGQLLVANVLTDNDNELYIDPDIIVLANPEIAQLPVWVVGLVAAGGLAAALSTAAGLLLVISTAVSHDLVKRILRPTITERDELVVARIAIIFVVAVATILGIYPPAFVAQIVAFAFGLAASTFFPVLVSGIFSKRVTKHGAIAGMLTGLFFTGGYILFYKYLQPHLDNPTYWLFGISPEGIGVVGMLLNFFVLFFVSRLSPPPPYAVQEMVDAIRIPTK